MTTSIYRNPKAYVYMGYHPITDKIYVGARWANVKQNRHANEDFGIKYFTSSKYVKPIFDEFDWEIVFEGTSDEVENLEEEMISMYLKSGLLFNKRSTKNWNTRDTTHSEESRQKIREANTGENHPMFGMTGEKSPNYGKKAKRVICEHCGKDVAINIYARFHGDKCSMNPAKLC